jgi:hypothetical protein
MVMMYDCIFGYISFFFTLIESRMNTLMTGSVAKAIAIVALKGISYSSEESMHPV